MPDAIAGLGWSLTRVPPGTAMTMDELDALPAGEAVTIPAAVPGTVAGALREAYGADAALEADPDAWDWWFTTEFEVSGSDAAQDWEFSSDGIATYAGIWLNGRLLGSSAGAFDAVRLAAAVQPGRNRLGIRCATLASHPVPSRPRSRWRSTQAPDTSLRWHRTPLLGHIPWYGTVKVVGPWAPVVFGPAPALRIASLTAELGDGFGSVAVELSSRGPWDAGGPSAGRTATVTLLEPGSGDVVAAVEVGFAGDGESSATAVLVVPDPQLWWPATHGEPALYRLVVRGGGGDPGDGGDAESTGRDGGIDRGERAGTSPAEISAELGFRSVRAVTDGGGFELIVNGEPVFARGAVWEPLDPVTLGGSSEDYRSAVAALVRAGANLVRVCGTASYEQPAFYAECDRQGVMVWQDLMLATFDPPADPGWIARFSGETATWLRRLAAHPSLAVVSGGNEVEQQPTMWGLPPERYGMPVLERDIPALVSRFAPGSVHVRSTPTGGRTPIDVREGVCHYFGVGAYQRGLSDARSAGVRFAAESLAFAVPPEPDSIRALFGRTDPTEDPDTEARWRRGFAQDPGTDWTFADVVAHYAERFFAWPEADRPAEEPVSGLPWPVRTDFHRAAINHAVFETLIEWRRNASTCRGAMILSARDLSPGAGFGVIDSLGRPKSAWFAMKAALAPVAVAVHDEGLNGVDILVFNDRPEPLRGTLSLAVFTVSGHQSESVEVPVEVDPRGELVLGADVLLGGFHDLEYVWRFGDRTYDALQVVLTGPDGGELARTVHLLGGVRRAAEEELGLTVSVGRDADGVFADVSCDLLSTFVAVEASGFEPDDNYFHLPARGTRRIRMRERSGAGDSAPAAGVGSPADAAPLPPVSVRALNDARRLAGAAP